MASRFQELETYEVLKQKNVLVFEIVKWHFQKILSGVNKRLTLKRKFTDPFIASLSREIISNVFFEVYRAVRDFVPFYGFKTSCERNKKGKVVQYHIEFVHLGTFIHHFKELTGLPKTSIKNFIKKTFSTGCKANVVISEEKPFSLTYKLTTSVVTVRCHFETVNRFGNVTSY